MKKLIRSIERIFWWASGANVVILEKLATEHSKYTGIGGTIIFTALMACFAGGYAFFTAFKNIPLSVFFGIFWGALIFNLDRYIVSTFGVGDGKKTISRQELYEASPRIIMAILLGFVISTPLELKIFEDEIDVEIKSIKKDIRSDYAKKDSIYYSDISILKQDIERLKQEKIIINSGENKTLEISQIKTLKDEIKDIQEERKQQERIVSDKRNKYYEEYDYCKKRYNEKHDTIIDTQLFSYCNSITSVFRRNLAKEKKKLNDIDERIQKLSSRINELRKINIQNNSNSRENIEHQIENLQQQLSDKTSELKDSKKGNEDISKKYNGFMARLEAFNNLTHKHPALRISSWFITILLIFIEIAPILFKMMTEEGPYDYTINKIKHDIRVRRLQEISNINENINFDLRIHSEKNQQRLAQELEANKELLETIANAQVEIAKAAIEEWKKEKIQEAKENASKIIKSE